MTDKEYKHLYEELLRSQTEEEAFNNLKDIIKRFSSFKYKEDVLCNPFFKSLLPDVLESVQSDIKVLEQSINKELKNIDIELFKIDGQKEFDSQANRLKELKRDCIYLIYEIDEKKKDLNSLIK